MAGRARGAACSLHDTVTHGRRRVTDRYIEVAIIGGGAAGIAAGRRLADGCVDCLIVEGGRRLGGRAWTTGVGKAVALDLGCGWLHSADRNPWHAIAVAQGRTIDKTPPSWRRLSRRASPSILQAAPYRPPLPRPRSAWPSPACALRSRRPSSRCDGRGCRNPRDKPRREREWASSRHARGRRQKSNLGN